MQTLIDLINEAKAAANPKPIWVMEGGRPCPLEWEDCSQPVYRLAGSDHYDYGNKGGPGDRHCRSTCPHDYRHPPIFCAECGGTEPCGPAGPCGAWGHVPRQMGLITAKEQSLISFSSLYPSTRIAP